MSTDDFTVVHNVAAGLHVHPRFPVNYLTGF